MEKNQSPNVPVIGRGRTVLSPAHPSLVPISARPPILGRAKQRRARRTAVPAVQQAQLSHRHHVQPLQIARQTHQHPLPCCPSHSSQRKLPEPQHFLDHSNHRLHRAFPQPINRSSNLRSQFEGHLLFRAGIASRWRRRVREIDLPVQLVRLASGRNVGLDPQPFQRGDIRSLENNSSGGQVATASIGSRLTV